MSLEEVRVKTHSRPNGLSQHEADVYDFVKYVKGSIKGNPMVRSNSFTLDDTSRQRKCIQFSLDMESNTESYTEASISTKRRRSISVPELSQLRVLSVNPESRYPPIYDPVIEEDDETESYIVHDVPLRKTWSSKTEFLLTAFGLSLGLNNIWRFPYYCYKYSGGSFLIVYFLSLFFIGFPLLCMEFSVGQLTYSGQSGFSLFCPILKGTVLSAAFATSLLLPVYSTVNCWSMYYFFKTLFVIPPWSRCGYPWNTIYCIPLASYNESQGSIPVLPNPRTLNASAVTKLLNKRISLVTSTFVNITPLARVSFYSSQEFFDNKVVSINLSLPALGMLKWEHAILATCLWIAVFVTLRRNILFSSHSTYFLAILPAIAYTLMLIRAVTLDGAKEGLIYFVTPNLSELKKPELWLHACALSLHTLGTVLGVSTAAAKCNRDKNNITKDAIFVCFINTVVILSIGVIIFSTIGSVSKERRFSISDTLDREPGLPFVVYSELLWKMPMPGLFSAFFFFLLLCSGIDYQIFVVASVFTTFEDLYWEKIKQTFYSRQFFVLTCCCLLFSMTMVFITQNGMLLIVGFETYIATWLVVVLAFFEFISIGWFYGSNKFCELVQSRSLVPIVKWFPLSWSLLCPAFICAIVVANICLATEFVIPATRHIFLWRVLAPFLLMVALFLIPLMAYKEIRKTPKMTPIARLLKACKPVDVWTAEPLVVSNKLISTYGDDTIVPCNGTSSYYRIEDINFPIPVTLSIVQGLNRETML